MATTPAVIKFNHQLMAEDIAERGWTPAEFARRACVADMTVYRFLGGVSQTAPTAKKLADALGHPVRRYFQVADVVAASSTAWPVSVEVER
jgi:transcriptional regulator with XRE-family HTH domain